jgi:hypothetical protein
LALAGVLALGAWGQVSNKVFYFAHVDTPQGLNEATNAVRSIGDIRDVTLDVATRSLTVKGTADQIAIAGWLTAELDNTGNLQGTRDFPIQDPTASLAQVAYLSHVENSQYLQEVVNAVRSVTDIQRFFPMNPQKAIAIRALPDQVKVADWLLSVLDQPAGAAPGAGAPRELRLSPASWDARSGLVVYVAGLTHQRTPKALQEVTNVVRSIANIQRCFPIVSRGYLVMRGSEDQIALANWLLQGLDGPGGQGSREFATGGGQVALVAYTNTEAPESLEKLASAIRSETKMQRAYPFIPQKAVVMVGTTDQVAQAQQVIRSAQGQ